MSEKLDGVRAIWSEGAFWSRHGNKIPAPDWFCEGMPERPLDGEIWAGRGRFQKAASAVKGGEFSGMQFAVFDLIEDGKAEDRYAELKKIPLPRHAFLLEQIPCEGKKHLKRFVGEILKKGGEGMILKRSASKYTHGRSTDLLKLKQCMTDEAEFDHIDARGSFVCKWNGLEIKLGRGLSNSDRLNPPEKGDPVTFSYLGKTDSGMPRSASFVGLRNYE